MTKKYECPFCEAGVVNFYIQGELVDTGECSECDGSGSMTQQEHTNAVSGITELGIAMAAVEL